MESYPTPFNETSRQAAVEGLSWVVPGSEPILNEIVEWAKEALGVPTALVSVVDKDRQWFAAREGFEFASTSRDYSICAHTIMKPEPLIVCDTHADPKFADHPVVVNYPNVRFYAGAPIVLSSGLRVGSLCALDYVPRDYPPLSAIETLVRLAGLTARSLELRRPQPRPDALREQSEMHSNFLSLVGHELRTPLTSIVGYSVLLEQRLGGSNQRIAKSLKKAAEHLSELIEHLMMFDNLQTGEVALVEDWVQSDKLVYSIQEAAAPWFEEADKS